MSASLAAWWAAIFVVAELPVVTMILMCRRYRP